MYKLCNHCMAVRGQSNFLQTEGWFIAVLVGFFSVIKIEMPFYNYLHLYGYIYLYIMFWLTFNV